MALDHDGVDDQVDHGDIAAIDGAANLTAMCWVYIDTLELRGAFLSKGDAAAQSFSFGMTETNTHLGVGFSATISSTSHKSVPLVTGSWHHVAFAYNGSGATNDDKVVIYYDGTSLGALTHDAAPPATLAATTDSFFAGRHRIAGVFTDCKIALVKLWTATLTAAEITQEMQSYRPTRTANLLVWSPYDDDTSARDYSGNSNHGTVTGALQIAGPPLPGWTAPLLIG